MSFLQKLRDGLRRFMTGRNGVDELSTALLITSLVIMLISSFTRLAFLSILGWIGYILCIARMFSRNVTKRSEENRRFVELRTKLTTGIRQAVNRLKNSGKYRYFRCPECRSWLRLPRKMDTKAGKVTVTCGKCRHSFEKKV